jgi:hypothetical protein
VEEEKCKQNCSMRMFSEGTTWETVRSDGVDWIPLAKCGHWWRVALNKLISILVSGKTVKL